ncbi:MAG: penicillin-binding transpeptidase domain-containing protein [Acidimicrobiales bacterium]
MNRRIRTVALVALVCFAILGLQLANLQVRQANALRKSADNPSPGTVDPFEQNRGDILSSDGIVLAYSTKTNDGYRYLRHYPEGSLFAGITGYWDITASAAPYGLDAETGQYNQFLEPHTPSITNLQSILTQRSGSDSLVTTVSVHLQKVAQQALGSYTGSVVAIDPRTGAVLAMYSSPTYNPNGLSQPNAKAASAYYSSLNPNSGTSPLVNGAVGARYPPGSTFKVVTTATIFDHEPSLESIKVPYASSITLPETNLRFHNFADESCGGNLARDLALSCDTAYAEIGLRLGATKLYQEASAFGFNKVPPIDLPPGTAVASVFPPPSTFVQNKPGVAYSAIGQEDVAETTLQDALIAAGIADGGTVMTPHLLSRVLDTQGSVVATYKPHPWVQATSKATADSVRSLMLGVTQYGTAAGVGWPAGIQVAAKTGTAEVGGNPCTDDWLIATAPAGAGQTPKVAVAAVVVQPPGQCDGTGAAVAGPVVRQVLDAALGYP